MAHAAALFLCTAWVRPAVAQQDFSYPRTIPVVGADPITGQPTPTSRAQVAGMSREVLGATGRLAIHRKPVYVGRGGRVFVQSLVPPALAVTDREFDVYFREQGLWTHRGRLLYKAGGSRRISSTLVIPELPPGPILCEIHARGVHQADWQELVSAAVRVPPQARLRLGLALDGLDPKRPASADVVIAARPAGEQPVELLALRLQPAPARAQWETLDIDLASLAGREVRFLFRSRPGQVVEGPSPGVVWGAPQMIFDEKRQAFPAIVVVSLDSLRTGSLGMNGALRHPTPFLDAHFGAGGTSFPWAFTQAVTTLPAHMTMMTGLNPSVHGVLDHRRTLGAQVPTLPALLRQVGYRTVAFTDGGMLAGEFGFGRDFDVYDEGPSDALPPPPGARSSVDRATAWLRDHDGRPVFIFIHSYATRPFSFASGGGLQGRQLTMLTYEERLREADAALGRLVALMKERTVGSQSLLVLTSGHGEEFFEHGTGGHGTQLYDEALRIPMLFAGGRIRGGRRYDVPVGLVDLAPTLLELAGVEPPGDMQGRSLARVLTGDAKLDNMPYRFAEAHRATRLIADGSLVPWGPPAYAVRDGRYKVIWHPRGGAGGAYSAFDLLADPHEREDLFAGTHEDAEWVQRLRGVLQRYGSVSERLARTTGAPASLSSVNRRKLSLLGYSN